MARPVAPPAPVYDPTLTQKQAAAYLGCSTRQIRRMNLKRTAIPSTGQKRPSFGYLLSTLNAYRDSLEDPSSRAAKVRAS
jgi:hypothetical protein